MKLCCFFSQEAEKLSYGCYIYRLIYYTNITGRWKQTDKNYNLRSLAPSTLTCVETWLEFTTEFHLQWNVRWIWRDLPFCSVEFWSKQKNISLRLTTFLRGYHKLFSCSWISTKLQAPMRGGEGYLQAFLMRTKSLWCNEWISLWGWWDGKFLSQQILIQMAFPVRIWVWSVKMSVVYGINNHSHWKGFRPAKLSWEEGVLCENLGSLTWLCGLPHCFYRRLQKGKKTAVVSLLGAGWCEVEAEAMVRVSESALL